MGTRHEGSGDHSELKKPRFCEVKGLVMARWQDEVGMGGNAILNTCCA